MRPRRTPEYMEGKVAEAALALEMHGPPHNMTYRQIAKELGYNHPQSVVLLVRNYGGKIVPQTLLKEAQHE